MKWKVLISAVALAGLAAGVTAFVSIGTPLVVLDLVAEFAFVLWVGTASLVMLLHPEVDRVGVAGRTVFAR